MHTTLASVISLTLAADDTTSIIIGVVYLAFLIAVIAGAWKTFVKAGQPGWAIIIPIYNFYIITKIAGRPWWWMLLCCIPLIGFIFAIILTSDVSKSFGGGIGTTLGLIFLPFIFYIILGFGSAQYQGPSAA
jgi:hypothetical protein